MDTYGLGHTDVGMVKPSNEDAFLVDDDLKLYIVADGMGGHAAGEVASNMAIDGISQRINGARAVVDRFVAQGDNRKEVLELIERSVREAGKAIYDAAQADPSKRGMGTTVVVLLLTPKRGFFAHVGDSRIYLIRQKEVHQLTEDHSLVNEMIKRGRLAPEDAKNAPYRNAVTRAVGIHEDVQVDTLDFEIGTGDHFVMCTDGLVEHLRDNTEIADVLGSNEFIAAPRQYVKLANSRGGKDNVTALVVRIEGEGEDEKADVGLKLNTLREMPLFQHLSYVELVEVLNVSQVSAYKPEEAIFQEGDVGESMFVVLEGRVSIRKGDVELARLGPGGHFGEMAIMDKGKRSAAAVAAMNTRVVAVGRKPLFRLMRRDKEIAVKLLWCFVQVLNQRLRSTNEDLEHAKRGPSPVSLDDFVMDDSLIEDA